MGAVGAREDVVTVSLQDEAFRSNTVKQPIDRGLMARWKAIVAAKQQHVGTIRTVTINEVLKDLLDSWDAVHADQIEAGQ